MIDLKGIEVLEWRPSNENLSVVERRTCNTQDQTSTRPNTLYDDADDLQKQLDNEARDKLKFGKPKTIWVLHLPTPFPDITYLMTSRESRSVDFREPTVSFYGATTRAPNAVTVIDWDYQSQTEWKKIFPECGGRMQSPVDLPVQGYYRAKGARKLLFTNFDVKPEKITIKNDGKRIFLYGIWNSKLVPVVHGGAAHSRRYLFHSLSITWPSEHTVGGLQYPMESQAIHISSEYKSMQEALDAAPSDPQAFLGIVNIYKYGDHTQQGLKEIFDVVLKDNTLDASGIFHPLNIFIPPFKDYTSYQGSLTMPPCTESVLWLVRARSLPVTRTLISAVHRLRDPYGEPQRFAVRMTQPLNDRKLYLFNQK
ncbi:carbonic anhydrase 6-like [Battus philenor]|uniref:carbonic anhydrase 6-like n=1 Tax=Battus philenor TaxID=42288 RepID=UPI0035D0EF81